YLDEAEVASRQQNSGLDQFWCRRGRAELALRALDPPGALDRLDQGEALPGNAESFASAAELRGRILGELMDFPAAVAQWEQAESSWRQAGILGAAERCQRLQIELMMR